MRHNCRKPAHHNRESTHCSEDPPQTNNQEITEEIEEEVKEHNETKDNKNLSGRGSKKEALLMNMLYELYLQGSW